MSPRKPEIGELVRWGSPGSLVLTVERVGEYDWELEAWPIVASGWLGHVRADGTDGILWKRAG